MTGICEVETGETDRNGIVGEGGGLECGPQWMQLSLQAAELVVLTGHEIGCRHCVVEAEPASGNHFQLMKLKSKRRVELRDRIQLRAKKHREGFSLSLVDIVGERIPSPPPPS